MANLTIKTWLDQYVKIDDLPKFAKQLEAYRLGYVGYSKGHMSFYGAPYIGLNNIWFTTAYENKLVNNLLKLDKTELLHDLHEVDAEGRSVLIPSIYPARKVSGEWFNILLLYLAHRLQLTPHPHSKYSSAAIIALQIYAYRTLAAVHSNSFRYLGSEAIAKATYNSLSNKFILKQLKSWDKYIEYRAVAAFNSADYGNDLSLKDDQKGLLVLISMSNAIRSTFKIIYQAYLDAKVAGEGEHGESYVKEGEEVFLKEVVNLESLAQSIGLRFADGSIIDLNFVKHAAGMVSRVGYPDLLDLLKYLNSNYLKHREEINGYIRAVLAFISDKLVSPEFAHVTTKVQAVERMYAAVTNSNPNARVIAIREHGTSLVMHHNANRVSSYRERLRNALTAYMLVIWASS